MKTSNIKFRKKSGIALVSVVVMGAFGIAVTMAMYQLLLNVNRSEMSSTIARDLRNAAEIGADYAMEQLNASIFNEVNCPLDHATTDVPANYLAGFQGGTVKVRLRDLTTEEWKLFRTNSSIYSVSLDPDLSYFGNVVTASYDDVPRTNVNINYWRVLEVTASRGAFSRSLKVYLEPRFDKPYGSAPYLTSTTTSSYFSNPLFANSSLNLSPTSGGLTLQSNSPKTPSGGYSKYALALQTNKFLNFGTSANTNVKGDINVNNNRVGAPQSVISIFGTGAGTQTIEGRVESNSDSSSTMKATPGPQADPADNVLANADLEQPSDVRHVINDSQPLNDSASNPQIAPAPVPFDNAASQLPPLVSGTELDGSYYTSNLNTGSDAVNVSNTTRIFIQDGASSTAAATVDASKLTNTTGSASNLQIFYAGTRNIDINLSADFNGLIYAPNASVNLTGAHNFNGALVGNEINIATSGTDSKVTILNSLQNSNGSVEDANGAPSVSYYTKGNRPMLQGYKPISWYEVNQQLVQ